MQSNNDYMNVNRNRWDELVGIHEKSEFYDVAGFKAGRITVSELEREELGDVKGKSLLHLQCHFGMDTMSWARLGAKVTGVDYSEKAIALARSLAAELDIEANFVYSNIYDLVSQEKLSDQFDIVYTGLGVLSWLPDLEGWAKTIAHYLKPGGTFYILEGHSFMWVIDEKKEGFTVGYPYFYREAMKFEEEHSYADPQIVLVNKTEYGWNHSFSEIIDSLLSQGLSLEFFHEFPFCGWMPFPDMERGADDWYRFKDEGKRNLLPLMFSLKASKK